VKFGCKDLVSSHPEEERNKVKEKSSNSGESRNYFVYYSRFSAVILEETSGL